jgi:hypothetical protein
LNRVTSQQWRSTAKFDVGPQIAPKIDIVSFSAANLIGGFVFGSIGFVAFMYGKRMNLWKTMFLGIALMVYPYFITNDAAMIVIGVFGSTALFFFRE